MEITFSQCVSWLEAHLPRFTGLGGKGWSANIARRSETVGSFLVKLKGLADDVQLGFPFHPEDPGEDAHAFVDMVFVGVLHALQEITVLTDETFGEIFSGLTEDFTGDMAADDSATLFFPFFAVVRGISEAGKDRWDATDTLGYSRELLWLGAKCALDMFSSMPSVG